MSDPVSNDDIDDVLSSIRRLVTQDGNKAASTSVVPTLLRPPHMVQADETPVVEDKTIVAVSVEAPKIDRLVLTQALRIVEDDGDKAEPKNAFSNYEADMATMDAQEAALRDDDTPIEVLWTDEIAPDPDLDEAEATIVETDRTSLEATIAELEAAVTRDDAHEWEPDGSEEQRGLTGGILMNSTTDTPVEPIMDVDVIEESAQVDAAVDDDTLAEIDVTESNVTGGEDTDFAAVDETDEQDDPLVDAASAEIIAAVESNVTHDAWEVVASAMAGAAAARAEPTFRHTQPDTPDDFGPDDFEDELVSDEMPTEDSLTVDMTETSTPAFNVDESMLRALVVDIVREELHGEMGERITRNVRKLVRREINRVLASQNFD